METSSPAPKQEFLGPIKSYMIFHVIDNPLFWVGVVMVALFGNEAWAAAVYNSVAGTPIAGMFSGIYEWGMKHSFFWWGWALITFSCIRSYVKYRITRFAIEDSVLIVTRGKFQPNPFQAFERTDYTVALNLVYDVDVKKTLFQYIFGGGDVYVRTATNDIFHLEFVVDPHRVRQYLIEHSGIKNKPIIGIY